MAIVDLVMPKMGESIVEATIITWLKSVGDHVDAEEPILEVATDKVDSEVPSTTTGTLVEIFHQPDDIVPVGGLLARIETGDKVQVNTPREKVLEIKKEEQPLPPAPATPEVEMVSAKNIVAPVPAAKTISKSIPNPIGAIPSNTEGRFYSPLVRNIARAEGVSVDELNAIAGTGGDGRVSKTDLINYVQQKKLNQIAQINNPLIQAPDSAQPVQAVVPNPAAPQVAAATQSSTAKAQPKVEVGGNDEVVELDRMRKVIAQHMKNSQNLSATVTTVVEADVTHLVHWRNRSKDEYQAKYGEKLTFSPLFAEAIIKAIGDYPTINASLDGDKLIIKKDINIGIATAMENGNLIVPVIKKAQTLSLVGLAAQLNDVTGRARKNGLKPEEIRGGTFTISNIGTFGNLIGTPIINQPELAIVALGAIKKKPIIQETPHGDIIAIRHMMFLSLSFDHRVIDGYLGGVFLNRIAHYIEAFDPSRNI